MNSRERFAAVMRFGRPDRMPYMWEDIREEVLAEWAKQGMKPGEDTSAWFPCDRVEQVPVDYGPRPGLEGIPRTGRELAELKSRLNPDDPGRWPVDWARMVEGWRRRDHLLQLQLGWGFFLTMGVGDWAGFGEAVELLAEEPALVREIMAIHGAFHARMADRVLSVVDPDFACLSEPLCTVHGPLISPHAYEEIVLASYMPVLETLRLRGVKTVVYMTFSNARSLLPAVFRAGFNCLWAYERAATGMDYYAIRGEFGPFLRLIGGLDTDAILAGGKVMRKEVESRVAELIGTGGYIPQADGRIRPNMPMRNYIEYRRVLDRVAGKGRIK